MRLYVMLIRSKGYVRICVTTQRLLRYHVLMGHTEIVNCIHVHVNQRSLRNQYVILSKQGPNQPHLLVRVIHNNYLDCPDSEIGIPDMHDVHRFWELEEGGGQIQDVQGRLKGSLSFWQEVLEAPSPIVECIKGGYKLPLLSLPLPFSRPNQRSALINADFVEGCIKELLENRCIHSVTTRPHICSPLSVVSNREEKKRLVLNLSYLNHF